MRSLGVGQGHKIFLLFLASGEPKSFGSFENSEGHEILDVPHVLRNAKRFRLLPLFSAAEIEDLNWTKLKRLQAFHGALEQCQRPNLAESICGRPVDLWRSLFDSMFNDFLN